MVYNNYPWSKCSNEKQKKIIETANVIIEVRALYPEHSLSELYDDLFMPTKLRKAHQANDRAVIDAYGFYHDISESEIVTKLMELYKKINRLIYIARR